MSELEMIRHNPTEGPNMTRLVKLCDLQQERIAELEAEAAEAKREQGDKSCPLFHVRCSACGVAIHDDGGCGCEDNRCHGMAAHQADRITKLEAEIGRYRDALQKVADMHTSHYDNLARHVIDVQSIIGRSMTPEVDAEGTPKAAASDNADYVLMPRRLTKENGTEAKMCGEFFEFQDLEDDGHVAIAVSWPTIQRIYAAAVKHLAKEA